MLFSNIIRSLFSKKRIKNNHSLGIAISISLLLSFVTLATNAQINVNAINANPCNGSATVSVINPASGLTVEYSLDGGAYQASNTFPNLKPDKYLASVRDKNTKCVFSKEFVIQALPDPNVVSETSTAIAPTLEVPPNTTYCNNSPASALIFTSNICYAQFNWTSNANVGFPVNGTGKILPFTAINNTNVPIIATVKVTATANGKTSPGKSFIVTVNPTPSISGTPLTQTICSGTAISPIIISNPNNVSGTTFSWKRDNVNLTGMPTSGSGNIIMGSLTNNTNCLQIETFFITANANGCSSLPLAIKIAVNPSPTVIFPGNFIYCNNSTGLPIKLQGNVDGVILSWNSNNDIGFGTSGFGNIPQFRAKNSTNAPITATVNVKATVNNCQGPSKTFTILVNPTPSIATTPNTQTVCSNEDIGDIKISNPNNVTGTTLTWQRDNTSSLTKIDATGAGSTITGELMNITGAVQATVFTITASSNGCISDPALAVVVVNPIPQLLVTPATQTIKSGEKMDYIKIFNPNIVTGTTFSWTRDNTTNITGIANTGTGSIITGKLTNTTGTDQTTTFYILATANGCTSNVTKVTLTVTPKKGANNMVSQMSTSNAAASLGSNERDEEPISKGIAVTISPNPTASMFKLRIEGVSVEPVTVRVMDAVGRTISLYSKVHNTLNFGSELKTGIYYVLITHGKDRNVTKLIKMER